MYAWVACYWWCELILGLWVLISSSFYQPRNFLWSLVIILKIHCCVRISNVIKSLSLCWSPSCLYQQDRIVQDDAILFQCHSFLTSWNFATHGVGHGKLPDPIVFCFFRFLFYFVWRVVRWSWFIKDRYGSVRSDFGFKNQWW